MTETAQATPSKTANPSKVEAIAELAKRLCLALTNVEMFSADHPLAVKGITSAFEWLQGVFKERREAVVFSVSGKTLVLDGMPMEARNPLVEKLAVKLDAVHVNSLYFEPQVTSEEFREFYRTLGKGPKYVDEHGGFTKLLDAAGVKNIKTPEVSYVMVTGDEKVVSKSARVVEGDAVEGVTADSEIAKYMVWKVLQKADEQKWLLNEMKNDPQKMAQMITDGIDLAVSRSEMGLDGSEESGVAALLKNIKLVGESLVDGTTGDVKEGEGDLEKALVTLESELRLRSSKLMSSKVATGFVNEILGIVTSYSDQVRAKQISDQFLKGERSLKRTEQLLKEMAPKDQPVDQFIVRIRDHLVKKGMTPEDLEKLVGAMDKTDEPRKPKRPAKPRKPLSQAVHEGVSKRLKDLSVDTAKMEEITESMGSFIEERAREKAAEYRAETEVQKTLSERRGRVLENIPWGVVLWDLEGKPEYVNQVAQDALGTAESIVPLGEALRAALKACKFPVLDRSKVPPEVVLGDAEMKLLMQILRPVTDEHDSVFGVILVPMKRTGAS